jgi:hypothetical protein
MTDVLIDRLSTRAQVRDEDDAARVRRLVADLSGRELGGAFADAGVPDGLWCVRRLDVDVVLDDRAEREQGRAWARLVVDALLAQLDAAGPGRGGTFVAQGPDVVRYTCHVQALLDLVSSVARRRADRAWAWRASRVLELGDPDPALDGRGAVMAALLRRPAAIAPGLAATASAIGVAPLHHLLGASGWITLAALVARRAGIGDLLAPADQGGPAPDAHSTDTRVVDRAIDLAVRALGRSELARAWRVGPVEIDHELARSIAVLAVADAEPVLLGRGDAAAVLHAAASILGSLPGRSGPGLVVPRPAGAEQTDSVAGASTDADHRGRSAPVGADDVPPAPDEAEEPPTTRPPARDDPDEGPHEPTGVGEPPLSTATVLGGLVHLFATADAAGVPDRLVAEPALSDLLPSAVLRSLLVEMADGEAPGDPMFAALSGQSVDEPLPALSVAARAALRRSAERWRRVTAEHLDPTARNAPAGPVAHHEAVAALLRRRGHVLVEPGWVEVHLRLGDVDLDVRRAGLDLDPGFVPWLGAVVVIRYA